MIRAIHEINTGAHFIDPSRKKLGPKKNQALSIFHIHPKIARQLLPFPLLYKKSQR